MDENQSTQHHTLSTSALAFSPTCRYDWCYCWIGHIWKVCRSLRICHGLDIYTRVVPYLTACHVRLRLLSVRQAGRNRRILRLFIGMLFAGLIVLFNYKAFISCIYFRTSRPIAHRQLVDWLSCLQLPSLHD